jgi:hypothetical protein
LNCFRGIRDMTDEEGQLERAAVWFKSNRNKYAYAKTSRRVVYQGWAVTGRSDPLYHELGIRQHVYMDAANELWYRGKLNVMESYPFDFSDAYLLDAMKGLVADEDIEKWKRWQDGSLFEYNKHYYNEA